MKYLKMIIKNPWIILIFILTIHSAYRVYDTSFDFTNFTLGLLVITLAYSILDKLRDSIRRDQIDKIDKMSRASSVILYDKGTKITEDNEEYIRGFREAAVFILRDLK